MAHEQMNKDNFWKASICYFHPVQLDDKILKYLGKPDFISTTGDGDTPSLYWFTKDYVIRKADHWERVQKCWWRLGDGASNYKTTYGIAPFSAFIEMFDYEKEVLQNTMLFKYEELSSSLKTNYGMVKHIMWDNTIVKPLKNYYEMPPFRRGILKSKRKYELSELNGELRNDFDRLCGFAILSETIAKSHHLNIKYFDDQKAYLKQLIKNEQLMKEGKMNIFGRLIGNKEP